MFGVFRVNEYLTKYVVRQSFETTLCLATITNGSTVNGDVLFSFLITLLMSSSVLLLVRFLVGFTQIS